MKRHSLHPGLVCVVLAAVIVAALQGCATRRATAPPEAGFSRGTNAAWLGVEWVNEQHRDSEIAALAQDLAGRQIRYAYVFASYLRSDGEFNPTYAHAAEFTQAIKAAQPELNVQAWIGLPLARPSSPAGEQCGVDLNDLAVREQIVAFAVELVHRHGFDGIHLDPEPINDGDPAVPALLDEMRTALGPGPTLSIATRRIWPLSLPMPSAAGRFLWSAQ